MPDRIIVGSDHYHRIKHYAALGIPRWEIAELMNIPEARVTLVVEGKIQPVDEDVQ